MVNKDKYITFVIRINIIQLHFTLSNRFHTCLCPSDTRASYTNKA